MKPVSKLLGKQFGRLTVLSRAPNPGTRKNSTDAYWLCQCSCGKTTVLRSYALTTGHTQSCGCLKLEAPHLAPFSLPKYTPEVAAAQQAWRSRYTDLPFEQFFELAKLPCFYCGTLFCMEKSARQIDQSSTFKYNSLDRIDSSLGHTIDNVVPACLICNRAKLDRTLEKFRQHINDLVNNIRVSPEEYRKLSENIPPLSNKEHTFICYVQGVFETSYDDGDLTLDQFYQLSQLNCYYCGVPPLNVRKVHKTKSSTNHENFIYNGLDRLDSGYPHDYNNVVTCCKYCNFAKNNLSLAEFDAWIQRLAHKIT